MNKAKFSLSITDEQNHSRLTGVSNDLAVTDNKQLILGPMDRWARNVGLCHWYGLGRIVIEFDGAALARDRVRALGPDRFEAAHLDQLAKPYFYIDKKLGGIDSPIEVLMRDPFPFGISVGWRRNFRNELIYMQNSVLRL